MPELMDPNEKPIHMFDDNKGAIALSRNSVLHRRSKHIHIRYHIVRRETKAGRVALGYLKTSENIADMLTHHYTNAEAEKFLKVISFKRTEDRAPPVRGGVSEI